MKGDTLQGVRVDPVNPFVPGQYGKDSSGNWVGVTPNAMYAGLEKHTVVEHEDATITVSPSIEVKGGGYWHGFLERGVWREV